MSPQTAPRSEPIRLSAWLGWSAAIVIVVAASWCMPLFSSQDPTKGTLRYPPLYPVYFQSNLDAPLEMETCLGFPEYYRKQPYRISRPTYYAALAVVRNAVFRPLASLILGPPAKNWGPWPARDHIATYFIWLLANLVCLLVAVRMAYSLVASRLPPSVARLSALMLLTTPIVLLALREIHLNDYQIFTGMASLVFWSSLLSGRLAGRLALLASMGLGLALLGKPSLNLFGAGVGICLLLGQWRKLLTVLPAVALPYLLWLGAIKAMGLKYALPEVTEWHSGVWIFEMGVAAVARESIWYAGQWISVLGESLTPVHLAAAALGAYVLWTRKESVPSGDTGTIHPTGRSLLVLIAYIAACDFSFYFLVHRVHAVYYVGTLLGLYSLTAVGLFRMLDSAAGRLNLPLAAAARERVVLAAVIGMQVALAIRQLPRYPG